MRPFETPLVLIDGMNLAYRSYYAYQQLSNQGVPTGLYYGFLKTLLRLSAWTDAIAVCWDYGLAGDPTTVSQRKLIYPAYKANRKSSEGSRLVSEQKSDLQQVISWLGWPNVGVAGLEADDVIALIVMGATERQAIWLYSQDADLRQLLVYPNVSILEGLKRPIFFDKAAAPVPWNVYPRYLAMGGDKSDNIRPIPKVGPQKAAQLVRFGFKPERPWEEQFLMLRNDFPQYEAFWPDVQAAYRVVKLPFDDCRIVPGLRRQLFEFVGRVLPSDRLEIDEWRFVKFCAKHKLQEFLEERHAFFRVSGLAA